MPVPEASRRAFDRPVKRDRPRVPTERQLFSQEVADAVENQRRLKAEFLEREEARRVAREHAAELQQDMTASAARSERRSRVRPAPPTLPRARRRRSRAR